MKRWIRWAACLYPASWRERYGAGFDALLEDAGSGWSDWFDVLRGAMAMRITSWNFKLAMACGLAGALAAGAIAFQMRDQFVSTALLQISGGSGNASLQQMHELQVGALSRASLESVIGPYGLYKRERQNTPMEDVVQRMRTDTRIMAASGAAADGIFMVSFACDNPEQARMVDQWLVTRLMEEHGAFQRNQLRQTLPGAPRGTLMAVLDPPGLPKQAVSPNRIGWIALGLGAGLLLAALIAGVRRWPIVAASGLAGALLAAGLSFLFLPERFVSSAMLVGPSDAKMAELVGGASLREIIQEANLYPSERTKRSMEDLIQRMRQDIRIQKSSPVNSVTGSTQAFAVSFAYSSQRGARAGAELMISRLMKGSLARPSADANVMEVIDPPSYPERPAGPNRSPIAGAGLIAGFMLGALALWFRQRRNPALEHA